MKLTGFVLFTSFLGLLNWIMLSFRLFKGPRKMREYMIMSEGYYLIMIRSEGYYMIMSEGYYLLEIKHVTGSQVMDLTSDACFYIRESAINK